MPATGEPITQKHTGEPGPNWDHAGECKIAGNLAKSEHQVEQQEARIESEANRE